MPEDTQALSGLAIHTTSDVLGLALVTASARYASCLPEGRQLADNLQVRIAELCAGRVDWRTLDWFAVAIGPGSFTGIRLGVMAARTLAQTLDRPLLGINSLAAAAQEHAGEGLVAVSLDARRGDRFAALYHKSATALVVVEPERLVDAAEWPAWRAALPSGTQEVDSDAAGLACPIAAVVTLAERAWAAGVRSRWFEVEPFYGRPAPIHGAVVSGS